MRIEIEHSESYAVARVDLVRGEGRRQWRSGARPSSRGRASVEPGSEVFHRIVVAPAVDFSRLSFVYLLEGEGVPSELTHEDEDALP